MQGTRILAILGIIALGAVVSLIHIQQISAQLAHSPNSISLASTNLHALNQEAKDIIFSNSNNNIFDVLGAHPGIHVNEGISSLPDVHDLPHP